MSPPRRVRTVRGLIGTLVESAADAVRSLAAPVEETEAPDPAGLYEPEEMPDTDVIEAAAAAFERAADQARRADRSKRAARKVLDRLPAGLYGRFRIFRTPSSRQTPDLAAITATYKRLNLGPVPMKPCAPSLKVEQVESESAHTAASAAVTV
ncbi:hypothetical protein [Streptomyces sp. TP-A0356]|uniref:hypothetical protein n=1 Tax=Streptomyces sp. TP-A0356 TaxID=1359208 RepID=UPI0006E1BAC4|nr:hypothetical protein [Streptomyces sp. TP-A0356]